MALLYTPQNQILDTKQIIFSRCMQRSSILCLIFVMLPSAGKFIKNDQNLIIDLWQSIPLLSIKFSRCMQRSSLLCLIFVMLPSAGKFIKNDQNIIIYLYSNLFPCSHSNIWKSLPPNFRSWEKYKNNWDITCLSLVCHTYLLFVLAVGTPPKIIYKMMDSWIKGKR